MKILKFRESNQQDLFYQELRQQVQQYLSAHHWDGYATPVVWVKATLYVLLAAATYGLIVWGQLSFAAVLVCWAMLGLWMIGIGLNIAHDAAHDTFFKNRALNKILFSFSFNTLGANAYLWKMRHVDSHHLFPNVDDCDADIDDNPFIRLSPYKPLRWYHRYQHLYAPLVYPLYTLNWILIKDFIILGKKQLANLRNIHHPKSQVFALFLYKIIYFWVMLYVPWHFGGWSFGQVLAGFLLLHAVSSYVFIFGLVASHFADGCQFPKVDDEGYLDLSWSKHQIVTSLDYHATDHWANWIFGGFNAHVAHHLFPKINHVHYPAISVMVRDLTQKHHLPYRNTTMGGAIAAHFRYLRTMGGIMS